MCYKLITFDITGTLLKGRKPIGEIYAQAGKLFGINDVEPEQLTENFKKEWIKFCRTDPNFGLHSGSGWESWWKNIVKSTFNSSGYGMNDKTVNRLSSYLIKFYSTKEGWKCEDGAVDLLKNLHLAKVEMGVISNFDTRLYNILHELELNKFFSFVLTSYETSFLKPNINIFKEAQKNYEKNTGLILKQLSALHIGNSIEHDINGARGAGWSAALVSNDTIPEELCKDNHVKVFNNLRDLNKYLCGKSEKCGFSYS